MEVGANRGTVIAACDAMTAQVVLVAETGAHEDERRSNRAGGQHDSVGVNYLLFTAPVDGNANRPFALKENMMDEASL